MENKIQLEGNGELLANVTEKGMYLDAASKGITFGEFAEEVISTKEAGEFKPTIYKGLSPYDKYYTKKAYFDRNETPPPDAFELMLSAQDIKTKGISSDPVSKFFQSSSAAVLYPWFIMNEVHSGSLARSIWQEFVGVTSRIDGLSFKKVYLQDTEGDRQMGRSTRGATPRRVSAKVERPI